MRADNVSVTLALLGDNGPQTLISQEHQDTPEHRSDGLSCEIDPGA